MTNEVFNKEKSDYSDSGLFLGDGNGLFDTVNKKYPKIWSLYKQMKSLDWDENEVSYSSCITEFQTCDKSTYDMMIKTLAFQWEADSVANRISPLVGCYVTSSELWAAWQEVSKNECLTPDHDVFVKDFGWKSIADVKIGDEIIQYNTEDETLCFGKVSNTISKKPSGKLLKFQSRNFNQIVTEKHRMVVKRLYSTNENSLGNYVYDACDAPLNGSVGYPVSGKLTQKEKVLEFSDKDAFWIAFQADGSYKNDKYNGRYSGVIPVSFSLKKERKKTRLRDIVNSIGWELREYELSREGYSLFNVMIPVEEMIHSGKTFGWIDYSAIDNNWCEKFISELSHWDGCKRTVSKCITTYSTTVKECADTVLLISSLCGKTGALYVIPEHGNRKELYQVNVTERTHVSGNVVSREGVDYEGLVNCVTVDTGAFLVRHNDVISVTGNCVHAATYSEIVRNSFEDPKDILDEILRVEESFSRLSIIGNVLNNAKKVGHQYQLGLVDKDVAYEAIFMFTVAMLCLERIQFMSSFAVTFAICDTGLFQPIGKIVQKIAQDELEVHVELDKAVLEVEMDTQQGIECFEKNKHLIKSMIDEVVESEEEWVDYLFSEGRSLVGITPELLKKWSKFCAADVYATLGFDVPEDCPLKNPLPFMRNWLNISLTQPSPQEQDNTQYKVNIVVRDDEEEEFDFDL